MRILYIFFVFMWNFTSFRIFSELWGIFKAKQALCMWWTSSLEFNSMEVVNGFSNWFWIWQDNLLQKSVKSIVKYSCYCHWIASQNFAFVILCKLFKVSCITLLFHYYLYDFRPSKISRWKGTKIFRNFQLTYQCKDIFLYSLPIRWFFYKRF